MKTFDEAFALLMPSEGRQGEETFERIQRDLQQQTLECFMNPEFGKAMAAVTYRLALEIESRPLDNPAVITASHIATAFILGIRAGMEMEKAI